MFGIKEIKQEVSIIKTHQDQMAKAVCGVMQEKNNEIRLIARKLDTLLDYLGLEYHPETVLMDCIEEKQEQKGKK